MSLSSIAKLVFGWWNDRVEPGEEFTARIEEMEDSSQEEHPVIYDKGQYPGPTCYGDTCTVPTMARFVKPGGLLTDARYFGGDVEVLEITGYYGSCATPSYTIRTKGGEIVHGCKENNGIFSSSCG